MTTRALLSRGSLLLAMLLLASGPWVASANQAPIRPAAIVAEAVVTPPQEAQSPEVATTVKDALRIAKTAEKAGELQKAEFFYRKVSFVSPGRAKSGLKKVTRARAAKLFEQAEALDETYPLGKADLLRAAYSLDPKNRKIVKAMEELGYKLEGGVFRGGAGLAKASGKEEDAKDPIAHRRQQLRLAENFEMIRRGPFRFFTNVDVKNAKAVIGQMINSNLSHYREYCRIMSAFGLNTQVDTIDLVLFNTKEEYHRHVRMPGSAGVYMPALGAGFFYRDGGYNFSTMLHEMTHQLNDKVLGARNHGWYEEGISEYFGAASMSQAGKRMKLGLPDGSRYGVFKNMARSGDGYVALKRFAQQERAQLTSEYYAQAWALTFYLMEHHPKGRLIIFDYVAATSGLDRKLRIPGATSDLETILKKYGITLTEFEKGFLKHYREN